MAQSPRVADPLMAQGTGENALFQQAAKTYFDAARARGKRLETDTNALTPSGQVLNAEVNRVAQLTPGERDTWAVNVLRRAQNYAPLEQPDGQQGFAVSQAMRQLVLGRAGSYRAAAFGASAAGSGGF